MHRTRNLIIVLAAIVVLIVFAVVISRHSGNAAVSVKTQRIALANFTVKLPENGVVMHPHTATIPTLVAGNIGQIYVRSGEYVSQGQLLATVQNPTLQFNAAGSEADYSSSVANVSSARVNEQNAKVQYQAAVDTALANLKEAKRVYDADLALLQNKAIARNVVDADKAKLDVAQVTYDQAVAQLRLGAVSGYGQNSVQAAQAAARKAQILNSQNEQQLAFTRIVAPFSGMIQTVATQSGDSLRSMQPGDSVSAGQSLFTIAGGAGYIVKAQVDEQDIINVRVGQHAIVSGQDFPGTKIRGHVVQIAPVAVKSTDASSTAKQVLTTIALDESPSFLKDGMSADVDILTTEIPNAIAVPNDAIVKDGGKSYVYLDVKGIAKKQLVTTGRIGDTTTIVTSGLSPGEVIVAQSNPLIKDGTAVKPMPSPSPSSSPATP